MSASLPEHLPSARPAPAGGSDRAFGLVFAGFFLLIALLPLLGHAAPRLWSIGLAAVFLLAALLHPAVLAPLNRLWTRLGSLMHMVVSPIALLAIYLLAFVPFGLACRLMRKDLLQLKADPQAATYWIERTPAGRADQQMKKQF